MGNTKESPTVLSFCTGYGGLEDGFRKSIGRIRTLAYVEIEAYAIANLVGKMESFKMAAAPIWTNVKTFSALPFRGKTDFIIGSYPCQPFSNAGKRKGSDDPRHLWPYFRRAISECEPGWVFFENVQGHINIGLPEVLRDLEQMGYKCEIGLFSANEVGAPHERKRVFTLGKLEFSDCYGQRKHKKPKKISSGWRPETAFMSRSEWPGRPGEKQKEWEFSRTMGEVESVMGRAANGCDERVDRIRLLGNGVMPDVSQLAYEVLYERITSNNR